MTKKHDDQAELIAQTLKAKLQQRNVEHAARFNLEERAISPDLEETLKSEIKRYLDSSQQERQLGQTVKKKR